MSDVTQILSRLDQGDLSAADQLLPLVYDELRRLASARLASEKPGQTLQATALVHEAYLRLVGQPQDSKWDGRRHFFAAAAEARRRILVENARRKKSQKEGGQFHRKPLDEAVLEARRPPDEVISLHEALDQLAEVDAMKAELVKLRYFAGLTIAEAAEVLDISTASVDRHWSYARAWLYRQLGKGDTAT